MAEPPSGKRQYVIISSMQSQNSTRTIEQGNRNSYRTLLKFAVFPPNVQDFRPLQEAVLNQAARQGLFEGVQVNYTECT